MRLGAPQLCGVATPTGLWVYPKRVHVATKWPPWAPLMEHKDVKTTMIYTYVLFVGSEVIF